MTAMQKKFNITDEVKGLKPTKQIERNSFQFMNHTIYQEDYGGQRIYRDQYLKFKNRYLHE